MGSLLRTAEGLGVDRVYMTGYTPYPAHTDDSRLPHEAHRVAKNIQKTALGAEATQMWHQADDIGTVIDTLKQEQFVIYGIEQGDGSVSLPDFEPPSNIALIVGREVEGIEPKVLALCDGLLEIPMFGRKESYNVVQATAMALYHCRFIA